MDRFKNTHSGFWSLFCWKVFLTYYILSFTLKAAEVVGFSSLKVFLRIALLLLASIPTSYLTLGLKQQRYFLKQQHHCWAWLLSSVSWWKISPAGDVTCSTTVANQPGNHYLGLQSTHLILGRFPHQESLLYITTCFSWLLYLFFFSGNDFRINYLRLLTAF